MPPKRPALVDKERIRILSIADLSPHPESDVVPAMGTLEYEAFGRDVAERGIQVPLDATPEGFVLDGRQRLKAACENGLELVPVRVVQPASAVAYMLLAALRRRDLSASQRAALALELDEVERAQAEALARKRAGSKDLRATLPEARLRPREVAARLAGASARTVQDALTVRDRDPELFAQIKKGVIPANQARLELTRRERYGQMGSVPALPAGLFDLIYADPPWRSESPKSLYAPENHYPTLPLVEITSLEIQVADDALLFLWAVNGQIPAALAVMSAWGFEYRANLVWTKPSIGLGYWCRNRHELLLIGRRGSYPLPEPKRRADSVVEARRGRHSEKPARFYELIEYMYPDATRLELFARSTRPGWTSWGNEIEVAA